MLLITGTDEDTILQIMINCLIGFCRRAARGYILYSVNSYIQRIILCLSIIQ
jgi:hypothetical protein